MFESIYICLSKWNIGDGMSFEIDNEFSERFERRVRELNKRLLGDDE